MPAKRARARGAYRVIEKAYRKRCASLEQRPGRLRWRRQGDRKWLLDIGLVCRSAGGRVRRGTRDWNARRFVMKLNPEAADRIGIVAAPR
jgi:hypothetical protein